MRRTSTACVAVTANPLKHMENDMDLIQRYTYLPPEDTRKAAHIDAAARKQALYDLILDTFGEDMYTADEMAAEIGEAPLSVRPRMTELFRKGKIVKTPLRRQNLSGKKAIVWAKAGEV